MRTQSEELIDFYRKNKLDLNYMKDAAKRQGTPFRVYLTEFLKSENEGVHGNVINKVVNYLIN